MWWKRRDKNGFPEKQPVTTRSGATRQQLDVDEVIAWYDVYMSKPWQGRKRAN
jgi:hypothetical protein